MASRTLVVDNGASTIKCGYAGDGTSYRTISNNITRSKAERKTFVGDQLDTCKDFSGLYYRLPFEKVLSGDNYTLLSMLDVFTSYCESNETREFFFNRES